MSHKYHELTVMTHARSLSDELVLIQIDLGKVFAYFQQRQDECFAFINRNCLSPAFASQTSSVGSARLFSSQLGIIVNDATPDGHFFWFKKLYAFYQESKNKEVLLEKAIEFILKPHIQQLHDSYTRIHRLYLSLMLGNGDIIKYLLKNRGIALNKINFFTKSMPETLIDMAIQLGDARVCPTSISPLDLSPVVDEPEASSSKILVK